MLKRLEDVVFLVNTYENGFEGLSLGELKEKSLALKQRIKDGELEEQVLPEAFALVREASKRTLGQRHFDVQIMGGVVLHEGKIAEMKTGEGKTLVATLPAYLKGLSGKGVHVVTVNDYLARRDAVWMGQIYHALGLRVSCLTHDGSSMYDPAFEMEETTDVERDIVGGFRVVEKFLRPISRKEAYEADITYGTNHEFGFDYLRDNLSYDFGNMVQRGHEYAIIDEVDSILIDEARTPLIIAAPDKASSEYYKTFSRILSNLSEGDYEVDEKLRTANLTDLGIEKTEHILGIENIFSPENSRLVHFLNESLKAKTLFKRDRDYMVKDGEIVIVDEFTGRMLHGRRYSGGLHQAIEAKEGVSVREENRTYAQITLQNYFRLYKRIAGMTGTAETSAEEFHKVYSLDVISVPTNKQLIREELPDRIYKTKEAKYEAIAHGVKERHEKGQPILVGTTSIQNNEIISGYLSKAGVPHEVLNAKNNEREGSIIAQAGRVGAVTVATNMAGRGVDIILGGNPPNEEEAKKVREELGGLFVLGTERHEARRIDNQLRGRCGRQGDPGSSQFFLSLEDDLVRIFGGDRIKRLMEMFNLPVDMPIEAKMVSKAVNQAQQKVEGANFDARKHLLDFDDVLNKHRTAIYSKREKMLKLGFAGEIMPLIRDVLSILVEKQKNIAASLVENSEEKEKIEKALLTSEERIKKIPEKIEPERSVVLGQHLARIMDMLWVEHLESLEGLRDSVNIRAYGQHEPLVEYRREAHILFKSMNDNFETLAWNTVFPILEMDIEKIKHGNEAASRQAESSKKPGADSKHIGRNDPCWCNSGKKYKKCHGK